MYNTILYIGLIIFLLFFTLRFSNVEHLSVNDITVKKSNDCGCDEVKSLSNLVSQYNILNDKITNLNKEITSLKSVKDIADKNKKNIATINNSIKKFEETITKK